MRRTIYVAGPYTGSSPQETQSNVDRARDAGVELMALGWAVIVPHTLYHQFDQGEHQGRFSHAEYMEACLELVRRCDAVFLLKGWAKSAGASQEADAADRLGLPVIARLMPPDEVTFAECNDYTLDQYQQLSSRTMNLGPYRAQLASYALGVGGESGEVLELVKKHLYHGHVLDREEVRKELGDVLWYVAATASLLKISLGDVARGNVSKLLARYPDGFRRKDERGDGTGDHRL